MSPISRRVLLGAMGAAAAAAVLVACGKDGPTSASEASDSETPTTSGAASTAATAATATEGSEAGDVVQVRSNDNSFMPQEITVAVGTTVEWVNRGSNDHDILPAEGNPLTDFGVEVEDFPPKLGVYRYTFTEPGQYDYFCSIHGNKKMHGMVGTVIVE